MSHKNQDRQRIDAMFTNSKSNVLVRVSTLGIAGVLIDFGSAKLSDQDMFPVMNSSQPDNDSWSPPEYVLDPKKYTEGTTSGDIWSLACTCYEVSPFGSSMRKQSV